MSDTDDEVALAVAEALADAWHPDDKHVIRAIREPVAIARRALRDRDEYKKDYEAVYKTSSAVEAENRKLREKLERVRELFDVENDTLRETMCHDEPYCFSEAKTKVLAAIADAEKGTL